MESTERMLKRMNLERALRALLYSSLTATGVLITIDQSTLVLRQVNETIAYFWSVEMIVAGVICAAGAITDRWVGEFTGLPLLMAVVAFYGLSAVLSYHQGGPLVVGYGLTMFALTLGLLGRYREVRKIKREASRGTNGEEV